VSIHLTLHHRLWRLLPPNPRRRALSWAATLAAPKIAEVAPLARDGVILAGEFTRASGLGESARLTLGALRLLGVPVWPIDIGPMLPAHAADVPPPSSPVADPPAGAALVLHVNAPLLPLVMARLPRATTRARRVVGLWAWELPVASPEWRSGARFVHDIWATSRFAADALTPLAPGKARVVRLPLAAVPPRPSHLGRRDFSLPDAAVVVLTSFNLASSFERKNPLGAIAAFRAAFGDRMDRILVLKVGNRGHAPADFARLEAAVAGASNICLETRTLPRGDSLALTAAADIVLSLHRSEGFGLVPAEAMLLGRPVVATGWSGNMDFMDDQSAALIQYTLVPARDARGVYEVANASWAEPDIDHAATWLRRLADDPAARIALGEAGRTMALGRLGTESLAEAVLSLGSSPSGA
jgi:glycosyltransferase involved in cell wall biosynthesis